VLYIIIIVALVTFLSIVSFSFKHRQRPVHSRRRPSVEAHPSRPFSKRTVGDPEERYVQGVGYIIGDLSCSYNARSPYIRCAVNPNGLCQDCRYYHNRDDN
jgi:hypothetical protein